MSIVFRAGNEPLAARLDRWRDALDETFGPVHLRPPVGTHLPEQLVVGDVGAVRVSEVRIAWGTPFSERC